MQTNTQSQFADKDGNQLVTCPPDRMPTSSGRPIWGAGNQLFFLIAMLCAILFLDAVLPLGGLWFHTALLSQLNTQMLLPTHLLFPGWEVSSTITSMHATPPAVSLSWEQVPFLLIAFLMIFLLYLFAIHRLPRIFVSLQGKSSPSNMAPRYIFYSTLLLGGIYMLIPVVTSPDIFSYIAYARMGIIYHLNPLTTLPTAIRSDPVYVHLYWNDQPSAYGPTWAAITSFLQWLALIFGTQSLLPMVIALRLFGLAAHLASTLLVWSIIGHLQRLQGQISPSKRILATLAFAWNPLLLFEACVNAHNDTSLLLLVLLAIWLLLPHKQDTQLRGTDTRIIAPQGWGAITMLALATCLKLNAVLLVPFVLIYVWKQAKSFETGKAKGRSLLMAFTFFSLIVLLYAPFWQNGAILNIFHTNPSTFRDINTLAEFVSRLYNGISSALGHPLAPRIGSPAENFMHTLSIGSFVIVYIILCLRALRTPKTLNTLPSLIRWLALAWLLYCAIGTPWFWPWYLVTFFGLYALVQGSWRSPGSPLHLSDDKSKKWSGDPGDRQIIAVSLLAFSMLSIYCFYAWGPQASFIPGLPGFQWAYLSGLWAWGIPLLAIPWYGSLKLRKLHHMLWKQTSLHLTPKSTRG